MKKTILIAFAVLSASSAFAGDFTKEIYGCYKVTEIRFSGDSVQISGVNVIKGQNGIAYGASSGEGYSKEEFRQNVESAKFAMANDLQICIVNGSRLLTIRK